MVKVLGIFPDRGVKFLQSIQGYIELYPVAVGFPGPLIHFMFDDCLGFIFMRYVRRSGWGWTALGSLVVANLVLPSFALPVQARTSIGMKYVYPQSVVQTYVAACGGTATDRVAQPLVHSICMCTIDEFQNQFSLREFRAMGQAIQAGQAVPEMDQVMLDCARQVLPQPAI
jgi:hypothetical protein